MATTKAAAKKTAAKKSAAKKAPKYGPLAGKMIEREMDAMKEGKLHSGGPNGPLVTNPKQAIAIALSETRKAGGKLPPDPTGKTPPKKAAAKKAAAKKRAAKT